MLRLHEGEKLMPYKCTAGKLTIGVGRNLEARGISKDESDLMLRNDIALVRGGPSDVRLVRKTEPGTAGCANRYEV